MLSFVPSLLMTLLMFVGIFLIGLILLQRGRGGGLAGAFGGMGGQSAFGTKAGDVFTRITIVAATVWILLCAINVVVLRYASSGTKASDKIFVEKADKEAPASTQKAAPADEETLPGQKNDAPDDKMVTPPATTEKKESTEQKPAGEEKQPEQKEKTKTDEQPKAEEKPKAEDKPAEPGAKEEPKADKPQEDKPQEKDKEKPAEPPQ